MKKVRQAQLECSNWYLGNCTGCLIIINKDYLKRNNWAPVFQTIDSKKANKPCTVETGCEYFEKFVRVT
tara:strand:+ start:569 stop:775 length:207 start_codon:yes stop_codon:yes gene_type:complete